MTAALALVLAAAAAQTPPQVSADPATCNAARARRVEFHVVLADPEAWFGRCISVRGLWAGRAFFARTTDARRRYAESREDSRDRRIGIYASDELARMRRAPPRSYRAVGMLLDCSWLCEGQVFVSGYCHNHGTGPILAVTEMRPAR
ncbi:MAG TPA: hypothetical protein VJS15_06650 [Allosphingosinicella sp.]|nr:hypothetical protein [Allosphingosinicella sp.]